jgi:hypothetical protein
LALNSPTRIFMRYLGNLSNTHYNFSQKQFFTSSILCSVGTRTSRTMTGHQRSLSFVCDILSLTIAASELSMRFSCAQKLYHLLHGSYSSFRKKKCNHLLVRCHGPPIWPPALPLNLIYLDSSLNYH